MTSSLAICAIAAVSTAGVIIRPFAWPEAIWAVLGAFVLLGSGLIGTDVAVAGVLKGTDVYFFLLGMMLLAETARLEGVFDWLAARATKRADGSAKRLFLLLFLVGTLVTIFMSNDATAVVLTPAVAASVKAAKVKEPMPFLFTCAFIANAASFVLPISNPANLVIYGSQMPPLLQWLRQFTLPSLLAIGATYAMLRVTQRASLEVETVARDVALSQLGPGGKIAASGLGMTAIVLLVCSGFELRLGLPTTICGGLTAAAVLIRRRMRPWAIAKGVTWSVLPLVAGLFVLVEALEKAGVFKAIANGLHDYAARSASGAAWAAGIVVAVVCNVMNNLPAGLIVGSALQGVPLPDQTVSAVLVGVDLGPNLSVTGSLATILWLNALKREGIQVSFRHFLKIGFLVMTPALLLALQALIWF